MRAYRTHLVIKNPRRVMFSDLPFRAGQRVEVLFLAQEESRTAAVDEMEMLLKETQSLPQVQLLTEDDILAEVEAYRKGQ